MTKALEALRELVILAGMTDKEVNQYEQKGNDYNEQVEKAEIIIKKALRPPKAEEVCEALGNDFEYINWKYDNDLKVFWGEHINQFSQLYEEEISLTVFAVQPNAKTISLIGRFYEGIETNE